jgi:hypothetical protein
MTKIINKVILILLTLCLYGLYQTFTSYCIWLRKMFNIIFFYFFEIKPFSYSPSLGLFDPDRDFLIFKVEYEAMLFPIILLFFFFFCFLFCCSFKKTDFKTNKSVLALSIALVFCIFVLSVFLGFGLIFGHETHNLVILLWKSHSLLRVLLCVFGLYSWVHLFLSLLILGQPLFSSKQKIIALFLTSLYVVFHLYAEFSFLIFYGYSLVEEYLKLLNRCDQLLLVWGLGALCMTEDGSSVVPPKAPSGEIEDLGPCKGEYDNYKKSLEYTNQIPAPVRGGPSKLRRYLNAGLGTARVGAYGYSAWAKEVFDACMVEYKEYKQAKAEEKRAEPK